ncbi:MAG: hypothetical protein IPK53_11200 [bacterium]|nr:hypothetical protein [bacterium]
MYRVMKWWGGSRTALNPSTGMFIDLFDHAFGGFRMVGGIEAEESLRLKKGVVSQKEWR